MSGYTTSAATGDSTFYVERSTEVLTIIVVGGEVGNDYTASMVEGRDWTMEGTVRRAVRDASRHNMAEYQIQLYV
jgi:hypothetical protein